MKINNEMVDQAYYYTKKVYLKDFTRSEGKMGISNATGMIGGSAQDYILVFLAMMVGEEYRRTINTYATKYYLDHIKDDFGIQTLKRALDATEKHTKYYGSLGRGNLTSIEKIVEGYKGKM